MDSRIGKLSDYYDPRNGKDRAVAFARTLRPSTYIPRAKDINLALETLVQWGPDMERFERRYGGTLTDAEKLAAIRGIMPAEVYEG